MRVDVELPKGKYCTGCAFEQTVIDSWGYEESHEWCSYLLEELPVPTLYKRLVKKHPKCPTLKIGR